MKKHKILCVSEYFEPHWTGLAKSFLSLCRSLAEEGHDVTVLTVQFRPELKSEETCYGLRIIRAPYLFQLSRTQYSPQSLIEFIRLARKCDTVVVNSPYSNILPVSIAAKTMGKRLVIFHQGDLILATHCGLQFINFVIEKIFDLCTISSMYLADKISTYSEDYAKHSRVMRRFIKKFTPIIPTIRTFDEGDGDKKFEELIADLKSKYVLVGFAGRFVEEKGFDILFRAIPHVISQNPNVRFVFAGETAVWYERFFDYIKGLTHGYSEHLVFLGLLGEKELRYFYESLSVFVLCSRSDCFALTQAEAALKGVPVVVSDIPGARVLVKETGYGEIVPTENPEALAEGILKVLGNTQEYKSRASLVLKFLEKYDEPSSLL